MSNTRNETTQLIRDAALWSAHGSARDYPEPHVPTPAQALYLQAIEAFKEGRQCTGWDLVDTADQMSET